MFLEYDARALTHSFFAIIEPGRKLMSNYPLRDPESLLAYARLVAQEEKVSMNQFFVTAIQFKRQSSAQIQSGG